ncbi:MAG: transglutaminase-like domain-containing protein, partial [Bacteroidales bacterium]
MKAYRITAIGLLSIAILMVLTKIVVWDYSFRRFLPKTRYEVTCMMSFEGFNEPVRITTFLPQSDERQTITEETNTSPSMGFGIEQSAAGKMGIWQNDFTSGNNQVTYTFQYMGSSREYLIDSALTISNGYPRLFDQYLKSTPEIQVDHPRIREIYQEIVGDEQRILPILQSIHDYTGSLTPRPFKGVTDALTAAKLGEASCNGKSRLFVALARSAHIPARLVGGLILENGTKKTSHQWVEAYILGEWVPFDPLNDHFASIPFNYVSLYRGDEFLFSHTPSINFDYS